MIHNSLCRMPPASTVLQTNTKVYSHVLSKIHVSLIFKVNTGFCHQCQSMEFGSSRTATTSEIVLTGCRLQLASCCVVISTYSEMKHMILLIIVIFNQQTKELILHRCSGPLAVSYFCFDKIKKH